MLCLKFHLERISSVIIMGGIERSEIEACRETNRVLLEGKANNYPGVMNTTVRESASGARLPDSAINPTPRTK